MSLLLLIISCTRNVRIWQTRVRHIYKVLCIISARHQRFSRHRLLFTLTIVTSRHIEHNHDNISYPQQACWHTMDWSDRGLRAERNISVHRQGRGFRGKVWICYRLDVGVAIVMSTCVLVHADFKFKHHNSWVFLPIVKHSIRLQYATVWVLSLAFWTINGWWLRVT